MTIFFNAMFIEGGLTTLPGPEKFKGPSTRLQLLLWLSSVGASINAAVLLLLELQLLPNMSPCGLLT
jgi:hypothetical protein